MSTSTHNIVNAGYRANVALRGVIAIVGGYFLAAEVGRLTAHVLPLSKVDAVLAAAMIAFVVYLWLALWAFHCRSATKLCSVTVVLYGACLALAHMLGRGLQ